MQKGKMYIIYIYFKNKRKLKFSYLQNICMDLIICFKNHNNYVYHDSVTKLKKYQV